MRIARAAFALAAMLAVGAPDRAICRNAHGAERGRYYMLWRDGGEACLMLRKILRGERG